MSLVQALVSAAPSGDVPEDVLNAAAVQQLDKWYPELKALNGGAIFDPTLVGAPTPLDFVVQATGWNRILASSWLARRVGLLGANQGRTRAEIAAGVPVPTAILEFSRKLNARDAAEGQKPTGCIKATPFAPLDPATFPRRRWVYGRHMLRKVASVTYAPGGVGKTTLVLAEAICLATGRSLLGVECHEGPLRVWVINLEDPLEELQRKVLAICLHYGIDQGVLVGRLFLDSGKDTPVCLATQGKNGVQVATPQVLELQAAIRANKIDVLILDPFISAHKVSENDNTAIDTVAKLFGTIADATNCAVELVHHTRKLQAGGANTVEDGRGASSLLYAVRSARVLNAMSQDEAEKAGVEKPREFFRVTAGKGNFAPVDGSEWYKLASVSLGNDDGNDLIEPDLVGVATPWKWPDPLANVNTADLRKAQQLVSAGKYRESVQAEDWVGHAVAEALKLDTSRRADKAKISTLLKLWIGTGMFVVVNGKDAKGTERKFVEVGKAAAD